MEINVIGVWFQRGNGLVYRLHDRQRKIRRINPLLLFNFSVADAIYRRKTTFLSKVQHTDNTLLGMFGSNMAVEIANSPL